MNAKVANTAPIAASATAVASNQLLQRQCACGNHITSGGECSTCTGKKLQRKLSIGSTNDPLEMEADRVEEQVLADKPVHSISNISSPKIHRHTEKPAQQTDDIPASVERVLATRGAPLPGGIRKYMEQKFKQDFSQVRMYTGSAAERSAHDMHANAYTLGNNIVFNKGKFSPETHEGKRLLAHELTHVVQAGNTQGSAARPTGSVTELEAEAKQIANNIHSNRALPLVQGVAPGVGVPLCENEDDLGPATFGNLPQDEPDPEGVRKRVELVEKNGIWYERQPDGSFHRAQGNYDFVVQNSRMIGVKGSRHIGGINAGHTEAANGRRVEYAGTVSFGSNKKQRGIVREWSNASGHYAPVSTFASKAGLPMDKFKPVTDGFPDKGPQLPVFQPKKGDVLLPREKQTAPNVKKDDVAEKNIAPVPQASSPLQPALALQIPPHAVAQPSQPIPPPPDWLTAKQPVQPTAPAAVVATNNPRLVGQLYSPNLQQEYRNQQMLMRFSQVGLDMLEAKEAKEPLSDEEQKMKVTLTAQVAAAQARVLQSRKDAELLGNPASTPQQIQEMLARRGVAVPVSDQTHSTGTDLLGPSKAAAKADFNRRYAASKKAYDTFGDDADAILPPEDRLTPAERKAGKALVDQQSDWNLDDKGFTKKSATAVSKTHIDGSGMPVAVTDTKSATTSIGLGTASHATSDKRASVSGDTSIISDKQKAASVDLIKGEASTSKGKSTEFTDESGTTKFSDKTTYSAGLSGITRTRDESTQVDSKLDSTSRSFGLSRSPGQLGLSAGETIKSGTMIGPADAQKMDKGTEKTNKVTGGLVSDDKGTGVGGLASSDRKTLFGDGKSATTTIAAGGRCQVLVKQIEGVSPPKFTITTTISFDLKLGAGAGKEWEAKPEAQKDTGLKANASVNGSASLGMYAAFKRELGEAEALKYVEYVRQNGNGSKLPEHMILATGTSESWAEAKKLWQAMNGSPQLLKSMNPGEEVETNAEVSGDAKLGVGGGGSKPGGLSVGGDVSAKAKHKINVKKKVMPDGKIQVTALVDDEGELGGSLSGGFGAAGMKLGKSWTAGAGKTIVFVIDPKDPAFDSMIAVIDSAASPEQLERIARQNPSLVAAKTDKTVEGEGTTVGATLGPASLDLGGKGKLTSEITRDGTGKVIGSKFTGENQGGGTFGVGEFKAGDSQTETYVGEVDSKGRARGDLSQTKKSTSLGKSLVKAGDKITQDPLGTLMTPSKLLEEETEQQGTAVADPEIMSICYEAINIGKWNGKVGGYRRDDWIATGQKIRGACVVRGSGRTAEIISVDKNTVQQAMATWMKADAGGRKETLDSLIRPLGGMPSGKAYAFPDGTADMKVEWDALVIADPLEGARAKLSANKPQDALAEMQALKNRVATLYSRVNSAASKWAGLEIQHAEMMGHINTRVNEINTAIRDLTKQLPTTAPAKSNGAAPAVTTVPTAAEVKQQEDRDRASEANADLEVYNNNIATMKGYAESVFNKLGQAEAKINDNGFFSGSKSSRLIEAGPAIKEAEDLLKIWDGLYWPTYKIYEKWSPHLQLDKSRLEKLHPAGARGRWRQVYDQTRDTAMAGR